MSDQVTFESWEEFLPWFKEVSGWISHVARLEAITVFTVETKTESLSVMVNSLPTKMHLHELHRRAERKYKSMMNERFPIGG